MNGPFGRAETLGLELCLPPPNERKFRNERNGVLPPPLLEADGLGVGSVGLPLTDGYLEGGTRPRDDESEDERGLITGIWDDRFVSAIVKHSVDVRGDQGIV